MRKIKKSITVEKVVRYLYNRIEKQETSETISVAKGSEMPPLPENCVLIEQQVIEEKEIIYTMDAETFLKYAKVEE